MILITLLILSLIMVIIGFFYITIDLYFMGFKIEKHPVLVKKVNDLLQSICDEEKIGVFNKSFDELNKDEQDNDKKAVGKYIYCSSITYLDKVKKLLFDIKTMELEYNMPYEEICHMKNIPTKYNKEELTYPRIYLCDDYLMIWGLVYYHNTFFHEIGHHFAIKKIGTEHTEEDANKIARQIILDKLPFFFQLIPNYSYEHIVDDVKLSLGKKIIAYLDYLKYKLFTIKNENHE